MEVMKKFISYYKPYKTVFFLDMFCALVISAVDLAFPQILSYLNTTFYIQPKDMIMQLIESGVIGKLVEVDSANGDHVEVIVE